jgi:hypothetical protein
MTLVVDTFDVGVVLKVVIVVVAIVVVVVVVVVVDVVVRVVVVGVIVFVVGMVVGLDAALMEAGQGQTKHAQILSEHPFRFRTGPCQSELKVYK